MPPQAWDQAAWDAAIVPTPQLVEGFEAATTAELVPSVVTGSVALSTVGPKFGAKCAVVQSDGGCRLEYPESQIPIALTRLQLGIWVRLDAQPPDTVADVKLLEVSGIQAGEFFLRIRTTEATPGLNDRFEWRATNSGTNIPPVPGAFSTPFALPVGVWQYLEMRAGLGTLSPSEFGPGYQYRYWHMATRIQGVDHRDRNFVESIVNEFNPAPPRYVTIDYPATPAEPGLVMALDRWWWWAGDDTEPMPQWWSSVLGWDGTYPLASISAGLLPGYNAALVSRNDFGVL